MGVNLDTLRPEPSVEGYSTPGGYSGKAVKPIALARVRRPGSRLTHSDLRKPFCTLSNPTYAAQVI